MGVVDFVTDIGDNYKDGQYNSGSHMVGWDSGDVRSEIYTFTTGDWPVTHIKWWGPTTSLYQGSNIPIRFAISLAEGHRYDYVTAHGSDVGYPMYKETDNEIDVNLAAHTSYCITFFPGVDRSEGWGLINIGDRPVDPENYFTIHATELDRTKCGAPTTLTLTPSIVAPGGTSRLSWSGATAGQNSPITGYSIYRSTSSSGQYEYLTSTGSNVLGVNVTAPATSGQSYYYKVVATTTSSAYNSDFSVACGPLKANTAPNRPTVSVNKDKVPSSGGTVTFTVTPGSDPDGQILSLYYATSASGTKTKFTSPLTTSTISSETTYYFYTYDGIAYSSETTKTITVNTKPVISSLGYNTISSYVALGGNGIKEYQLGFANKIKPTVTTNKTGKITLGIEYYSSNGTETFNTQGTGYGYVTMQEINIPGTSVTLDNFNIHQFIPIQRLGSTNLHWRIYARLNDGIEVGDWVYYPSEASGQYYSIAHTSDLLATYNQFADSDISGTAAGQIWRNVRLKVYNDSSVPIANVTAATSTGTSVAVNNSTTSVDGVYRYIDITLQDGIAGGTVVNLTVPLTDQSNSIVKTIRGSVTETLIPTATNFVHGAQTVKPFTGTGTFEISMMWPFGEYATLDEDTLEAFNCSTTVSNVIKIIHSRTNSGSGTNRVEKSPSESYPWEKNGSTIQARMDASTLYEFKAAPDPHELGYTSYSGVQTYYCRIEITNLFGKVISSDWIERSFDFREPVQTPLITSVEWSANGTSNWATLDLTNEKIQKGIYLRFNCSFGLYSADEITVTMNLKTGSNTRQVTCYESGAPSRVTPITYSSSELSRADSRTPASNTKAYIFHVTSDIADVTDREWHLEFKNAYLASSNTVTTKVARQCAPTLVFTSCDTDADYNLTYAFTMTDDGGADSLTFYLCDDGTTPKTRITSALATGSTSGTIQTLPDYRDWEVKSICIEITSVVTELVTNTETYYSNAIIVYQLKPTIAYRQNQIGINTDNPDSNSTVDIHQASGKPIVLIHGVDSTPNLNPTKFEINATTGQIKFFVYDPENEVYVLKSTLDLMNGTLT